ncbi:hypothetical protein FHW23_001953 [Curtobacterium pusillum]|uniref:Uncharacterized protein n=1 Tax=Curtobacterium pusillum TaxID=69373 RepID=A0AAW3T821_9MICO|nr:hypothetical protein [Curtobacterium pusillum]MBA8990707.1 hypothetical protein [Curtobacterium pusillum]
MAQRSPARPTARIEEAIGFVGMFGTLFLGVTVFCEVTRRPALGWALVLLVCVLGVVVLDRWRVSVLRRTDSADGIGGQPAGRSVPVPRADHGRSASASAARVGRGTTVASADARVHRHVGWDELAPAGRQQVRQRRRAAAAASPAFAGATDARSVADPAPAGHVTDVTRPSDG